MKAQRRLEIVVALLLATISYFSNYYLFEPGYPGIDPKHGIGAVIRGAGVLSVVIIGYFGLLHHEARWVRAAWVLLHVAFMLLMLINKLSVLLFHQHFVSGNIQTPFETFLVFLVVAYLPRWLRGYHKPSVKP